MRKILAAFLAVLMLVGLMSALPVFAAEDPVYTSPFDMTSSNEKMEDLIITEIVVNSKSGDIAIDSTFTNDAFDYIEVLNNSDHEINLYDYEVLSASSINFFTGRNSWDTNATVVDKSYARFTLKSALTANVISGELPVTDPAYCKNPATAKLQPGEVGVIWFWNQQTSDYNKKLPLANRLSTEDGQLNGFRKHYGMDAETVVVATKGFTLEVDRVYALCYKVGLNASNGVGGTAVNTWNIDVPAYDETILQMNPAIVCMAEYSQRTGAGIAMTSASDAMTYNYDAFEYSSANYVPSYLKPDLFIQNQRNMIDDEEQKADYDWYDFVFRDPSTVDAAGKPILAGLGTHLAHSYRECAIAYYGLSEEGTHSAATPGQLPAWQWMYLNSDKLVAVEAAAYAAAEAVITPLVGTTISAAINSMSVVPTAVIPANTEITTENKDTYVKAIFDDIMKFVVSDWATADIKTEAGRLWTAANDTSAEPADKWEAMCMADYLVAYANEAEDIETGIEETKKNYAENFVDRDYLIEKHSKKDKTNNTSNNKKGLPVWALILIIVGGVVVAGGIAVAVIFIIKKKNKPVAADDVAAEGEIEVIDEGDAPADNE